MLKSGPWVEKGNPTGFLDSENGELFDWWGKEQAEERFERMTRKEWRGVAEFLLGSTIQLLQCPGEKLNLIQAILGKDGSEGFEGGD